jgi:hypothetical protein
MEKEDMSQAKSWRMTLLVIYVFQLQVYKTNISMLYVPVLSFFLEGTDCGMDICCNDIKA